MDSLHRRGGNRGVAGDLDAEDVRDRHFMMRRWALTIATLMLLALASLWAALGITMVHTTPWGPIAT